VLQRGLEVANVKGVAVQALPGTPAPAATYDVTWTGR